MRPGNGGPEWPPGGPGDLDIGVPKEGQVKALRFWLVLVGGIILLLLLLNVARSIFTEWLWFDSLEYSSVYVTIFTTRIWLFAAGALIYALILTVNFLIANRGIKEGESVLIPPEIAAQFRPWLRIGAIAAVVLLSLIFGSNASGKWQTFLLLQNVTPFGVVDPAYGKDISFYVFILPALRSVHGWLLGASIVTAIMTVIYYFALISVRGGVFTLTPAIRNHVAVLLAIILLIAGWGYWLHIFDLLFTQRDAFFGAGFVDVTAKTTALKVMMAISGLSAIALLVSIYRYGLPLAVGALGLWFGALIIGFAIYPAFVQRFQVVPNELGKERPYIERSIEATRQAFALDPSRLVEKTFPAKPLESEQVVLDNPEITSNIRLWDPRPLKDIYNQIQFIRLYYEFQDVDVDRYVVDGEYKQVMLSARELDPGKLPSDAQRWVNQKLQYTHGYGVAMSPVTTFTQEGRPEFYYKDIPPVEIGTEKVVRPEIYFGEKTGNYVVVNSKMPEFDYPSKEDVPTYTSYQGKGGVRLSNSIVRAAYAWQFADFNILISSQVTSQSRIQYFRNVQERVGHIAPFLRLDADPYLVVADGQLFWIQDAYTVTNRYPYSQPHSGGFNYIRNSVKAVVNAYDGTVDFYVADPQDPLIRAYSSAFPDLFKPLDEMPDSLRAHIRYPEDLFTVQAETYLRFHMTDPNVFFNKEDMWSMPSELFYGDIQPMDPYYLIMKLPGETEEELVLLLPFTPFGKRNMVGWLAARNDAPHYGEMVALSFPKDVQIDGPQQVEGRIDADTSISQQFTLWGQVGSKVLRGNLLVIPIGESIIYVEPVYLQPAALTFPELKRVIVATQDRVVMMPTLQESLKAVFTGAPTPVVTPPDGGGQPPEVTPTPLAATPTPGITTPEQEAIRDIQRAIEGLRSQLAELEKALQRLSETVGK